MSNVKALFGNPIPTEPDPDVIERLEALLEEAKSGDVQAIAYVAAKSGDRVSSGWVSNNGKGHMLSTGILQLSVSYAMSWEEE